MHKIAIVIYSRLEGSANSAVYRQLTFAQELQRAGDDHDHASLRTLLKEGRQIVTASKECCKGMRVGPTDVHPESIAALKATSPPARVALRPFRLLPHC